MNRAALVIALLSVFSTLANDDYDQLSTLQVASQKPHGKKVFESRVKRFPGRKTLYPLPAAIETHELAVVNYSRGDNDTGVNVLVSQQSNSRLNFVHFPGDIGIAAYTSSFVIGDATSGLHGLTVSTRLQHVVVATLQFDSAIVWLDVSRGSLKPPTVMKTSYIPLPAAGPHRTAEVGRDVWVTCKGIAAVVRIKGVYDWTKKKGWFLKDRESDTFVEYLVKQNPIFVEGANGFIFATIDINSAIVRINPNFAPHQPEAVTYFDVPPDIGSTPVGMIRDYSPCFPGPPGSEVLWFVLGGGDNGGTGAFGKITGESRIEYFHTAGDFMSTAGYLHLTWAPCNEGSYPTLLLMASSTAFPSPPLRNPDGVATLSLDPTYSKILSQSFEFHPLQASKLHRIIASANTYFVDGLAVSSLQATTVVEPSSADTHSMVTDYFDLFGIGANGTFVRYDNPGCYVPDDDEDDQ